jgi:hypothetical protein
MTRHNLVSHSSIIRATTATGIAENGGGKVSHGSGGIVPL